MNEQKLSQRLATVAAYIPEKAILADIGSDHAYLPAWLILQKRIARAVAGEVVQGPFASAQRLVQQTGFTDKITVRLADGLAAIKEGDNITAVSICGMGGALIRSILEQGKTNLNGNERLILQPNNGEQTLRAWLMAASYRIIAETILEEDGKIYEIIVAEKAAEAPHYSERELYFGPCLLKERPQPAFQLKWQQELQNKVYVEEQLQQATKQPVAKLAAIQQQKNWIEEVLAE